MNERSKPRGIKMDCKLKTMLSAVAASLVMFTSIANAVDDMQMRNIENRVSALEQRRGSNGMINPPARPVVKDGIDVWVQGEALYFNASEDGLGYVTESNSSTNVFGRVKSATYDWDWGFRAGAGINMPHDGWDLFANWTWFHTKDHQNKNTEAGEFFYPNWYNASSSNANLTHTATNVKNDTHLRINMLDLELGREFFVSKWLTVRPHIGGRASWLFRSFKNEYQGGSITAGNFVKEDTHNRFRGAGLRGGLDSQWGLGSGWSFFGQMAFALVYGRQHVNVETSQVASSGSVAPNLTAHDNWGAVRGITDLALGLRWDQLFSGDAYRVRLQAAWEQHMFLAFNQNHSFTNSTGQGVLVGNKGDLSLSGVSFEARFDF
jgi:hypothetical protein